ncbi:MAG: AMP-binding protein [Acidimicrobiales bacterium]
MFDLRPDTDVYWCAADIGWVTGHSYIVYGPLTNGCTSVMYEGTPDTPRPEHRAGDRSEWAKDRLWDIIERYGVTQLYTAPPRSAPSVKWGSSGRAGTTCRACGCSAPWASRSTRSVDVVPPQHRWGALPDRRHLVADRDGWTHESPRSQGVTTTGRAPPPPRSRGVRRSGRRQLVTTRCRKAAATLTLTRPWPSMLRGIWGDEARYRDTYWSTYEGRYFAGDGARVDEDGYIWLLGRVDDVMNVSGHRISTAEVEALVDHPAVAEAAVVGATDDITGQAIVGYVILRGTAEPFGGAARGDPCGTWPPSSVRPLDPRRCSSCPTCRKTRSGKIMRRLLRDVADGRDLGDTTTLADPGVVAAIRRGRRRATRSEPLAGSLGETGRPRARRPGRHLRPGRRHLRRVASSGVPAQRAPRLGRVRGDRAPRRAPERRAGGDRPLVTGPRHRDRHRPPGRDATGDRRLARSSWGAR